MAVKKKKVTKKAVEVIEDKPKRLSDAHLRQIDKQQFAQKELDYEIKIVNTEIEKFQIKLESLLLKRETIINKRDKVLLKNKDMLREFALELKLKNINFGFDPISGEIKE